MLTKYLIETEEKCVLNGALSYGLFFNIQDNVKFFKNNAMKLYDKVMGFNFYMILKGKAEELKGTLGEEQANEFLSRLKENSTSLMDMSEQAIAPLHGYKSLEEYYNDT